MRFVGLDNYVSERTLRIHALGRSNYVVSLHSPGFAWEAEEPRGLKRIVQVMLSALWVEKAVHDLHATLLHIVGLDQHALTFEHEGRNHTN